MNRALPAALLLMALGFAACSERAAAPKKLSAREQEIVETVRRAVAQNETWADKAEYKIERRGAGWQVTAWQVVHPEAKGNMRYVPWGRSTILVDERGRVTEYRHGK